MAPVTRHVDSHRLVVTITAFPRTPEATAAVEAVEDTLAAAVEALVADPLNDDAAERAGYALADLAALTHPGVIER